MLGIITPTVQENITAVANAKVTLHVWTSNWGQRPAAATEALNKWDGGRAQRGEVGLGPTPSPLLGSGPPEVLPPGHL